MVSNLKKTGFTLIELVIAITVLTILSTIAFVSYNGHVSWARDSARLMDLSSISKTLRTYTSSNNSFPDPDAAIRITAGTWVNASIAYEMIQWVFGDSVQRLMGMDSIKDPSNENFYLYAIDGERSFFSIAALTENVTDFSSNIANANSSNAFVSIMWDSLGLLFESGSHIGLTHPAGETLNLSTYSWTLTLILPDNGTVIGSGGIIVKVQNTINLSSSPISCPNWFIPVPWNRELWQKWFCVAKYEMSYSDVDTPNTCDNYGTATCSPVPSDNTAGQTDWNTVAFDSSKTPVSMAGKFPIAKTGQGQAISACKLMGAWYHLITNSEWMTIARNIESVGDNWTTGIVGSGSIFQGITGMANSSTSAGCRSAASSGSGSRTLIAKALSADTDKFGKNKGSDCDAKRQHKLSNGSVIWDISGNVREHVNKMGLDFESLYASTTTLPRYACSNGSGTAITSLSWYGTDAVWSYSFPECGFQYGYSKELFGPKGNFNRNYGIGGIMTYGTGTLVSSVFRRGWSADHYGYWNAGIYTLDTGAWTTTQDRSMGFRCAKTE